LITRFHATAENGRQMSAQLLAFLHAPDHIAVELYYGKGSQEALDQDVFTLFNQLGYTVLHGSKNSAAACVKDFILYTFPELPNHFKTLKDHEQVQKASVPELLTFMGEWADQSGVDDISAKVDAYRKTSEGREHFLSSKF
jgi:hypothetical protein